ncbi:MAG: WYL domain-containing protein [Clostridia bacterium]|nr:WYL domain-containing protein [Clostridia bacterium]
MMYSELFSAYYNAVASILEHAVKGDLTDELIQKIVLIKAFPDSVLTIPDALKDGSWPLLRADNTTSLEHTPTMPLTTLQKRWLKAVLQDPRVQLFDIRAEGLEDVEPLFSAEDYKVYDRYQDGDPFTDSKYRKIFRTLLAAIHEERGVSIQTTNRYGDLKRFAFFPICLEYSSKDDKFRVISSGKGTVYNVGRITSCRITDQVHTGYSHVTHPKSHVTLEILDERSTLERVMNHFAHFEKRAEDLGDRKYRLEIEYVSADETELVINILSFGQYVKVLEPLEFREQIIKRLKDQKNCGLK